jgi:glutamine phosphoribosylpyrophosphate amidotransferase
VDASILEAMVASLRHRGPDDEGIFVEGNVGLGHSRLSIIDPSPDGHQPMFDANKEIAIVFNGEICEVCSHSQSGTAEQSAFSLPATALGSNLFITTLTVDGWHLRLRSRRSSKFQTWT